MVEASGPRSTASTTGFFRVPDLFVRLSSKAPSISSNGVDPDSIWSPTSPLDSSTRSSPPRVGLGLVDALTADAGSLLFGGGGKASSFLDSIRPFLELGGLPKPAATARGRKPKPASAPDEVLARGHADSEEYTCVISRGANPRKTHILGGGETLEVRGGVAPRTGGCGEVKVSFTVEPFAERPAPAPAAGVASGRCSCCMRRLPEDRDIFIYKGEKAFCSRECREGYIEVEVDDAQESLTTLDHAGSSTAFFLGEDW